MKRTLEALATEIGEIEGADHLADVGDTASVSALRVATAALKAQAHAVRRFATKDMGKKRDWTRTGSGCAF